MKLSKILGRSPKVAVLVTFVFGLAACGTSSQPITNTASSASTSSTTGTHSKRASHPPAAAGLVAAVTSSQMQVQSATSGEVTVTWTPTTKFEVTSVGTLSSISAGECVRVVTMYGTARSVIILASAGTSCSSLVGQGNSGAKRRNPRPGFGAIVGTVTAISGSSISINPITSTGATTTASLDPTTRITQTARGSASNLATGDCVVVAGSTNSIGAVSATNIAISPSVSGTCVTGGRGLGDGAGG